MYRPADRIVKKLIWLVMILLMIPTGLFAEDQKTDAPSQTGLQQRIDFGNAQILGQSIKSGAVYLMHRKKSDIKNMLEVRQHYRDEIKEDFGLDQTAIVKNSVEPEQATKK